MGLSIKHFIFNEDTEDLEMIPSSTFTKLFNRNPSVSLKAYSGKMIKYIEVIVQLENRKPFSIIGIKFHIMKIDQTGKFDVDFINELNINAAKLISVPMVGMPGNVIDSSSDFAAKEFKSKYSWKPTSDIENKVKEIIFGKMRIIK